MVEIEDLVEKFEITGCKNLNNEVLKKCIELCYLFNKDEEEFIDMWVAFGISHLDGNIEPTLETLDKMKLHISKTENLNNKESFEKQKEAKYFLNTTDSNKWINTENEILEIYANPDELFLMTKSSPDSVPNASGCKTRLAECAPPATPHDATAAATATSQTGFSQSNTPNKSITGSKVLMAVGSKVSSWTNANKEKRFTIGRVGPHVPPKARYMFDLLKTASEVRTRVCRFIGMRINSQWSEQKKDDVLVTWNVRAKHQQRYRTWGRICFESETKHSNPTVLLEGYKKPPKMNNDKKLWPQVELDFSELRECCLFPGQLIAVEGLNLTENLLKVHNIFSESFIPAAKPPHLTDNLNIVIAAGPFTLSNDLNYQPLWELMTKITEEEPHMLILIGPFLDHSHPLLQDDEFTCTYQEFFYKIITKIKNYISGKCTQVVLVASSRDVHHHPVYPTPEYFLPKAVQCQNIFVLPDPCNLDIEGFRLGITSIDSLMHLGRQEVMIKPSGTDKFSRLGNYILNQACYYPLYPPAKEVNIDSELWEKYAFLKEKPHVLLLPSDMRYFCKHVNETVILNPERLSKRTFARIFLKSSSDGFWTQDSISCEVIKM